MFPIRAGAATTDTVRDAAARAGGTALDWPCITCGKNRYPANVAAQSANIPNHQRGGLPSSASGGVGLSTSKPFDRDIPNSVKCRAMARDCPMARRQLCQLAECVEIVRTGFLR